jgi:hypothetical protein
MPRQRTRIARRTGRTRLPSHGNRPDRTRNRAAVFGDAPPDLPPPSTPNTSTLDMSIAAGNIVLALI